MSGPESGSTPSASWALIRRSIGYPRTPSGSIWEPTGRKKLEELDQKPASLRREDLAVADIALYKCVVKRRNTLGHRLDRIATRRPLRGHGHPTAAVVVREQLDQAPRQRRGIASRHEDAGLPVDDRVRD